MQRSKDFTDYIKLLKIIRNVGCFDREMCENVFFAYLKFVDRPEMFQNAPQLDEVDRLHIDLFERIPELLDTEREENRIIFK